MYVWNCRGHLKYIEGGEVVKVSPSIGEDVTEVLKKLSGQTVEALVSRGQVLDVDSEISRIKVKSDEMKRAHAKAEARAKAEAEAEAEAEARAKAEADKNDGKEEEPKVSKRKKRGKRK